MKRAVSAAGRITSSGCTSSATVQAIRADAPASRPEHLSSTPPHRRADFRTQSDQPKRLRLHGGRGWEQPHPAETTTGRFGRGTTICSLDGLHRARGALRRLPGMHPGRGIGFLERTTATTRSGWPRSCHRIGAKRRTRSRWEFGDKISREKSITGMEL